ncbi:MAG: hypothetical protein QOI31_3081 [Solirubrobacterales bacterium]|jgi:hypothetical protein|nr:hypothetical protein [Solirubrobacterales bacterium]
MKNHPPQSQQRTRKAIPAIAALALCVLVMPTVAQADTETVITTLKLQRLQPDESSSFISGKLSSPKAACTKGRKLEALARSNADSGLGTSLSDGSFQIELGGFEDVFSSNGYEASVRKKTIGQGNKKTVCKADQADVKYKSVFSGTTITYANGAFSGSMVSDDPACLPFRTIDVTEESVGGGQMAQADEDGNWTLAWSNPNPGIYRATVGGTFGNAQRPKQDGDLAVINCDGSFTQMEVE